MPSIEVEAKTLEEAINQACEQLEKTRDQSEIEVISDTPGKMFGIMGGKKVRIKATPKDPCSTSHMQRAREVLENILLLLGTPGHIESTEDDESITLTIRCDGSGLLIGRRGQTLDALQYLINKIVHRTPTSKKQIIIDSEGYRERRKQQLAELAKRLAAKAKSKAAPVSTGPLSPAERRIIHLALQDDTTLSTKSNGEGAYRRVVITPKHTTSS